MEMKAKKESFEKENFTIYEFDGKDVSNIEEFFRKIIQVLPQDPPLSGQVNGDAFIDSITGAFYDIDTDKVAVIWYDADSIVSNASEDAIRIVTLFQYVAEDLSTTKYGLEKPIDFRVLLVGEKVKELFE